MRPAPIGILACFVFLRWYIPRTMKLRSGVYIVPTDRWYIERAVWLIAGIVLLASTTMALVVNRVWILGVIATGLVSINVAFAGFCPVGNVLRLLGFTSMLGSERTTRWYRMKTDKWYLERRIYLFVGINISVASLIVLFSANGRRCSRASLVAPWCGSPRQGFA
jgi:hypothetical protein